MSITHKFEPEGGLVIAVLTPVDESDEKLISKRVEIQYGILTSTKLIKAEDEKAEDQEEVKTASRFEVVYPRVSDGMNDPIVVRAAKAQAALEMAIKQSKRGTVADYLISFENGDGEQISDEHEFFTQKLEAPKLDKDDVWGNEKYTEKRERLSELRGDAEATLEHAAEADQNSQEYRVRFAGILVEAYSLVGDNMKALRSWANGPDAQSNLPLLGKLGKGNNALSEAMLFAQISDEMRRMLPSSVASGKGIQLAKTNGVKAVIRDAFTSVPKTEFPVSYEGRNYPDSDGVWMIAHRIATKVYGVVVPDDVDPKDLIGMVNAKAGERAAEYHVNFGKSANMYDAGDKEAFDAAYGMLIGSDAGEGMFAEVLSHMSLIESLEESDAEDAAEKLGKQAHKAFTTNMFLKYALTEIASHQDTVEREKQNREVLKEVENTELVSATTQKSYGKLPALAKAGHLVKLLVSTDDHAVVKGMLDSMYKQIADEKKAEAAEKADEAGDTA